MDLELQGRVALVTGGSRGIGKAIARALAAEGVDLALVARGEDALNAAAAELAQETGRRVIPIVADVTSRDDARRAVAVVQETFGRLDILINNAGFPGGLAAGPLAEVSDEALLEDLNVKTLGYLRFAQAAAPAMRERGWGRIINIGGLSARQPGSYSAGIRNIAIVHMARTLSMELAPSGITVNVIHPGGTRTERTSDAEATQLAGGNMTGRAVNARDVADVAVFLASARAWSISGEVIGVGGAEPSRSLFL